jgi:hypothetical protein
MDFACVEAGGSRGLSLFISQHSRGLAGGNGRSQLNPLLKLELQSFLISST